MRYTYNVETSCNEVWVAIIKKAPLSYCQGYLDARKDYSPRNAYRILRSDDKVMEEFDATSDISIGWVAGWPTPEQYELAGDRAYERAKFLRESRFEKAVAYRQRGS